MNTHWLSSLLFLADAGNGGNPAPGGPQEPNSGPLDALLRGPFLLIILLVLAFYFVVMRPQRREQKKRQDMLTGVKKNDRVVTIGGIYGVVMNVHREADEVTLKVDEATNTKLRVTISSIARIISGESAEEESTK